MLHHLSLPVSDLAAQLYDPALAALGYVRVWSAGQPGLRPRYGPDYYAAFVFDLDSFALEAVYKG